MPTVMVKPWSDPILDVLGHDPRSWYVETFCPLSNARRVPYRDGCSARMNEQPGPKDRATSADRPTVDAPTRETAPKEVPPSRSLLP